MKANTVVIVAGFAWVLPLFVLSATFLFAVSYGGVLYPIPQQEGKIVSSQYPNDTLELNRNGVLVRASGSWDDISWGARIVLQVKNKSPHAITIVPNEASLKNSIGWNGDLTSVADVFPRETSFPILGDNIKVNAGQERTFSLYFEFLPWKNRAVPGGFDIAKHTVKLELPVTIDQASPQTIKFSMEFRYGGYPSFWRSLLKRLP